MRLFLAILLVVGMVGAWSSAATVYQPTKDTFWRFDVNGGNETYGGAPSQRAGKGWQDGFYMDFNRSVILSDAAAVLGHPVTAADFTSGSITVTLSLMATGDGEAFTHSAAYTPGYFTSTTAWTESQATYLYADKSTSTPWDGTGANLRACPTVKGSPIVWSAPNFTYQDFALPANIASGYLMSTAAGVAILVYGDDWNNNGYCYSKEAAYGGSYAGPKLTVNVVPEPATMVLLALGGLLVARRRQA